MKYVMIKHELTGMDVPIIIPEAVPHETVGVPKKAIVSAGFFYTYKDEQGKLQVYVQPNRDSVSLGVGPKPYDAHTISFHLNMMNDEIQVPREIREQVPKSA